MINLEPIEKEDLKNIVKWNADKGADFLLQWAGPLYQYPLIEEQIEQYLKEWNANESDQLRVYKIVLTENSKMVGTIEIRRYEKEDNCGRIGRFLIGEDCRGKGIGKEALKKMIQIGFEKIGYGKLSLGVFDFNAAAMNCYESCGFIKERYTEKFREAGDGYWGLYDMGIKKEDWIKNKGCSKL